MATEDEIAWRAALKFRFDGPVAAVRPLGVGLINRTYLVETQSPKQCAAILQMINRRVFARPELIIANHVRLLDHVTRLPPLREPQRSLAIPALYSTQEGTRCFVDAENNFWRAQQFIPNTRSLHELGSEHDAEEVGRALGAFHRMTAGLDPALLHDTLPGFHVTPLYLAHYDRATREGRGSSSANLGFCTRFVDSRRDLAQALEHGLQSGALRLRTIHGDPKLNNFLFDSNNVAVSLIDLDTVKPGLIHYDLGDCLRSCCNVAGEQPAEPATAVFDLDICRAILRGYGQQAHGSLTTADLSYLYTAIRLLPFELGLRFFTDHLQGNLYFKVATPEQNLARAVTQFHLVQSIERQEHAIQSLIREAAAT